MPATGWSETTVAGHLVDVFEPARLHPNGYVVLYLHGVHLNRLVDKPAFTREFERHGLRVIAPMTGRSWWTNRLCADFDPALTAERHLLDNIVPEIERLHGAAPPKIGLLGTSMGGQGALRIAFKYPNVFPVVAALSPAIDFQTRLREGDEQLWEMYDGDEEAARQDTATLHVHPLNWPRNIWFCCDPADARWHESAERLQSKLYSLGIPHSADLETSGGGHSFEFYGRQAPAAIEFMLQALEQEQRRLPTADSGAIRRP